MPIYAEPEGAREGQMFLSQAPIHRVLTHVILD